MGLEFGYLKGVFDTDEIVANVDPNDNLIDIGLNLDKTINSMPESGFKIGYILGSNITLLTSLPRLVVGLSKKK